MPAPRDQCSNPTKQRLGQILVESSLITNAKLQVALYEQQLFKLRLGEILVAHGWVKSETTDFFSDQWDAVKRLDIRYPLGQYLQAAGLLNQSQINQILDKQKSHGHLFGDNAVRLGLIMPETIEYFLTHLFPKSSPAKPSQMPASLSFVQPSVERLSIKHLYN